MYCTECGSDLVLKEVKKEGDIPYCKNCNKLFFPKVDLAMIAILTNSKNQVCLINQKNRLDYKVLIAGFIKPGENLEECVRREIKEEVGVEVSNCNYLNSHFYEANNVMMVGYHAETFDEDLIIDDDEVECASWFDYDNVIGRIRDGSIADKLYKQFYETTKSRMGDNNGEVN